ncbi:hypothetical protein [Catenovulum agarivorans]|uniref:hypothetical protein n=1 Tax=Catenovulum agarivorans TaxID=1172192 RepID=UPI0002EA2BDA|nr:hypothetical protein [Catenovulum agarivorans]
MELELVIGVTGHRNLPKNSQVELQQKVTKYLTAITEQYPFLQLRIVTGMAVGADWLVSQAALEMQQQGYNIRTTAVLPMPLAMYKQDFSPREQAQLETLLTQIKDQQGRVIHLNPQVERDLCYQNLSSYLTNKSDLLLSLWDLQNSDAPGGTAFTTKMAFSPQYRMHHLTHKTVQWTQDTSVPTYVIPVEGQAEGYLTSIKPISLQPAIPKTLVDLIAQLSKLAKALATSEQNSLLPLNKLSAKEGASADQDRISEHFAHFDRLANFTQQQVKHAHYTVAGLTVLISLLFLVFAKILPSLIVLSAYVITFVLGFIWYKWRNPNKIKANYTLYRAIAEALRIEFFWQQRALIGDNASQSVANSIPANFSAKQQVVKKVLKQASLAGSSAGCESINLADLKSIWLHEQLAYYQAAHAKLTKQHKCSEWLVKLSIFIPVGLLCLLFIPVCYQFLTTQEWAGVEVKNWLVFTSALLPLSAAAVEMMANNNSVKELLTQYQSSAKLTQQAVDILAGCDNDSHANKVLLEIGHALSLEHFIWAQTTQQKELSAAHGG